MSSKTEKQQYVFKAVRVWRAMTNRFLKPLVCTLILLSGIQLHAQQNTENIIPLQTLKIQKGNKQTFQFNFSRTAAQLSSRYQYKLIVLNADGEPHAVEEAEDCKKLGIVNRALCYIKRAVNIAYINLYRFDDVHIFVNQTELLNNSNFNSNTSRINLSLTNIGLQNSVRVELKGTRQAYLQLGLTATYNPPTDSDAPVVMSNLASNATTNNAQMQITVSDFSNVSVDVYKDGQILKTTTDKNFNIQLSEGTHTYTIKAKDQYGNAAADFILQNITLDTIAPALASNLRPGYVYQVFPQTIQILITSNEALSELSVNGIAATFDPIIQQYVFNYSVLAVGVHSFNIMAKDLAGNQSQLNIQTNISLDNQAPALLQPVSSLIYSLENQYLLGVLISDESATSTSLTIGNTVIGPFTEKQFSYLLEFTQDETKNITISTVDAAGNTTSKVVKVVRDSKPLSAHVLSPNLNTSVNTKTVQVVIEASKPIASVVALGMSYDFTDNKTTVTVPVTYLNDGQYSLNLNVTDIFGETVMVTAKFYVKASNGLAAWDYMECKAE